MSTLRVSNIEAKANPSNSSVDEKVKITNSNGDILLHLDGKTPGIGTVGVNTTAATFRVDPNQTVTFSGDIIGVAATFTGNLSVGGTITYDDVKNVDSVGIVTARKGIRVGTGGTVGPVGAGIVTYYSDGSQLTGVGGAVGGATTNAVFWENDQIISVSYTISSNKNAGTFGPVQVAAGQTVTIPSGSYWTIV